MPQCPRTSSAALLRPGYLWWQGGDGEDLFAGFLPGAVFGAAEDDPDGLGGMGNPEPVPGRLGGDLPAAGAPVGLLAHSVADFAAGPALGGDPVAQSWLVSLDGEVTT